MRCDTLRFRETPEDGGFQSFFRGLGGAAASGINYLPHIQGILQLPSAIHHANGGIADGTFQTICEGLAGYVKPTFANLFAKRIGCTSGEYRESNRRAPREGCE